MKKFKIVVKIEQKHRNKYGKIDKMTANKEMNMKMLTMFNRNGSIIPTNKIFKQTKMRCER